MNTTPLPKNESPPPAAPPPKKTPNADMQADDSGTAESGSTEVPDPGAEGGSSKAPGRI